MGSLNIFPVSYKVQGKTIVIIGGGDEALGKARLAVKTSADVLVFSRNFLPEFANLKVSLLDRAFKMSDLDNAALVFVEGADPQADTAIAAARARNVPLNVVDRSENCDFYTPAIVVRAPMSIAISSDGQSPVLSRIVRAKIEAILSLNLGALATIGGALRSRVAALLTKSAARRFYEELASGPAVEGALAKGVPAGQREALRLLDAHASGLPLSKGVVWLIGAGPGAEDLLTLRAQRALQEADVIVHDGLVPDAVVQMGRRDAKIIRTGQTDREFGSIQNQNQINELLVDLAAQNLKVARLTSGDPMVFGRVGEEIAALRAAAVDFSIIPGITAALAAAADSATPVTLHGVSSGFVVATAQDAGEDELARWSALAQSGVTLGVYLEKPNAASVARRLMEHGLASHTPVGVVINAGRPNVALVAGDLATLGRTVVELPDGPALILIGEAVLHGDWSQAIEYAAQSMKVA